MEAYEPKYTHVQKEKSRYGCILIGCSSVLLLTVGAFVAVAFGGYFFLKGQVNKYTSAAPMEIPASSIGEEEKKELDIRLAKFAEQIGIDKNGQPIKDVKIDPNAKMEPLILTGDELNALINSNKELKGKIFVRIDDGQLSGEISIPLDEVPLAKGRYFNASVKLTAELEDGDLDVHVMEAEVNGRPVPAEIMKEVRSQNIMAEVKDPNARKLFRKFESIQIEDDKIILVPRKPRPSDENQSDVDSDADNADSDTDAGTDSDTDAGTDQEQESESDSETAKGVEAEVSESVGTN